MANILKKFLLKNIQISYHLLDQNQNEGNKDSLYRITLKQFLESFCEELAGKHVLDLGTGSWTWTKQTLASICAITTFDQTPREQVDVVGDIYQLKSIFQEGPRFDACIATDVFEHLTEPSRALKQIRQVLAPGGLFIASTPFKKDLHGEEYGDYWRITRQGWRHLLNVNGFPDIDISWLGEERCPIAYFVRARAVLIPQTISLTTNGA